MKNITLSIPEDLLMRSREYAIKHDTSLNKLIRQLLRSTVMSDSERDQMALFSYMDKAEVKEYSNWTRDELYER